MRAVVGVIVLAASTQALADRGAAERAIAEAKTRAASNDFVGAAAKYREAHAAEPRPDLMCNVGVAYYKAKDLPRAQRYLEQCLAIGTSLDRAFIDNVKKVVAAVESTLAAGNFSPVDLFVQPSAATTTVEGGAVFDEPIVGSRRVWFPFGSYRLVVHAAGHVDRVLDIEAEDRKPITASVALERTPAVTGPATETGPGAETGSATEPTTAEAGAGTTIGERPVPPPPMPPVAKRSMVAPIVTTAVAAGAGGAALGFFLAARSSAEDAGAQSDMTRYNELRDQANDRQHISWGFAAAAGAAAIVSGVLWYRYASTPRVEVRATGSGAALSLSGRW